MFVGHQLERKGGRRLLRLHQEHLRDQCDLLLVTTEPVVPVPGVRVVSHLRGGNDALWDVLAEADLMCFPSTIDQAPNVVLEAMAAPRDIDMELVEAYLARRALDYLVGFTLSPVLWRKLPGARSAGRVQSVALRIVVDREMEIEKFKAQE